MSERYTKGSVKMKKLIVSLLAMLMLAGCSANTDKTSSVNVDELEFPYNCTDTVDVTQLKDANVKYAQVALILEEPKKNFGCHMIIDGKFEIDEYEDGKLFYSVIVKDTIGCCTKSVELKLKNTDNIPEKDTDVVVQGTFGYYKENGKIFLCLEDAEIMKTM